MSIFYVNLNGFSLPLKKDGLKRSFKEVKTIKIVQDSSPVSEKVMCYICRASLMSQYLVRHMKSGHSDDYKKKTNASQNIPTQIQPGECYAQTWEQAGELIARVLEKNKGKGMGEPR